MQLCSLDQIMMMLNMESLAELMVMLVVECFSRTHDGMGLFCVGFICDRIQRVY
jgi:hypothetical protein